MRLHSLSKACPTLAGSFPLRGTDGCAAPAAAGQPATASHRNARLDRVPATADRSRACAS